MTLKHLGILITCVSSPIAAFCQQSHAENETEAILSPIHTLFDGMRAGDSTMVRSAFDPIARLVTTFYQNGAPNHQVSTIDDFVKAVGTPHDKVWDERIWNIEVDVRDNLASVWMDYAFFLGEDFHHCGVNSFELFATEDGWKVIHIADTRQQEGCEMPSN